MSWRTYFNDTAKNYLKLEKLVKESQTKRDDSHVIYKIKKDEFEKMESEIVKSVTAMCENANQTYLKFIEEYTKRIIFNLKNYKEVLFKTVH